MKEQTSHTFHVSGMHCQACVLLTENELLEQPGVTAATSNLSNSSVTVTGDFNNASPELLVKQLSGVLEKHGYVLSMKKEKVQPQWKDFKIALPLALLFIALFVLLQQLGIVNLISSSNVSYATAFTIGIIASLSSCMAIVGGLVLSMSATFAQSNRSFRPQILFHLGRIISFFVLGGAIGALGASFSLNTVGIFILSLLVGLVLFGLGLNLLDVFPWAQRLQLSMPKFLSRNLLGVSKFHTSITPALIGIITFFLPCGFTQSMQVYALSTGSFLQGGLTMLFFALGTLPVLALVSFSTFSLTKGLNASIFFKTAGLIVIVFGLFNIYNALAVMGFLPPLLNI